MSEKTYTIIPLKDLLVPGSGRSLYANTGVGHFSIAHPDGFVYTPYICAYPSFEAGMDALSKEYEKRVLSCLAEVTP